MSFELAKDGQARPVLAVLTGYAALSLEEILVALCRVGKPRLSRLSDAWYCIVEMHVASVGAEFKVGSDFSCQTPIDAARQCAERVVTTLKQYA